MPSALDELVFEPAGWLVGMRGDDHLVRRVGPQFVGERDVGIGVPDLARRVQTGTAENGVSARVTPRLQPNGKILLRLEAQSRSQPPEGQNNVESIQTTSEIPDGGTLLFRGSSLKGVDGKGNEVLYLMTIHAVK